MNKLLIVVLLGLNAGCETMTPNYDTKFGDSIRDARLKMTINPDAGKIPDQVAGIDGKAAANTIIRYQETFKTPPPVVPVINVGGSISRGGEGN
jgi:hypothetical protein